MELQCAKWRHKSRFLSSWWKPIAPTSRRCRFAGNAVSRHILASWPNLLRLPEGSRWRNWLKQLPKPRKSLLSLIDERRCHERWIGRSADDVESGAAGAFVLLSSKGLLDPPHKFFYRAFPCLMRRAARLTASRHR